MPYSTALLHFSQRYLQQWQNERNSLPYSEAYAGLASPCIESTTNEGVFWSPKSPVQHSFAIIEEVMFLKINPSAVDFYCTHYAGDMAAMWDKKPISLIQIWSADDFSHFEPNMLAHLEMQRKRKLKPTLFIGTTDDPAEMIAIDNLTGEVILDDLVARKREPLAQTLDQFLNALTPLVL